MSCKKCILKAQEIILEGGVYLITLPDKSLENLCSCEQINVGLFTSIPIDTLCNRIIITDGKKELIVAKNNQYFRPKTLHCRSILVLEYRDDPELLVYLYTKGGK